MQLNINTYHFYPNSCCCNLLFQPLLFVLWNVHASLIRHYQGHKYLYNLLALFIVIAFLWCIPFEAFADDSNITVSAQDPPGLLNDTNKLFINAMEVWKSALINASKALFVSLLGITAVWKFSQLLLNGQNDAQAYFAELIKFFVTFGFFWWLITNNGEIVKWLQDSFVGFANQATKGLGTVKVDVNSPDSVVKIGFDLLNRILESINQLGWKEIAIALVIALMAVAIGLLSIIIAIRMLLLMIAVQFLIYIGIITLGFGALDQTKDWAIGYYKQIIAKCAELFAMKLVVAAGFTVVVLQMETMVAKQKPSISGVAVLLMAVMIIFQLASSIPGMIGGLFGGGSTAGTTGGSLRGMGAMGMAGVAGVAAGAIGAKKAIDTIRGRLQKDGDGGTGKGEGGGGGTTEGGGVSKSFKDTGDAKGGDSKVGAGGKGEGAGSKGGGSGGNSGGSSGGEGDSGSGGGGGSDSSSSADGGGGNAESGDNSGESGDGEGSSSGGGGGGGGSDDIASQITGGAVSSAGGKGGGIGGAIGGALGKALGGDGALLGAALGAALGAVAKKLPSKMNSIADALLGKGKNQDPVGVTEGLVLMGASLGKGAFAVASFGLKTTSRLGSAAINKMMGGTLTPTSSSFGLAEGASKIASVASKKIANSSFGKNFAKGYNEKSQEATDRLNSPLHKANGH